MIKIAPSILSADFARLGEEIESIRSADYLHFDVMDGIFVPNISIGIPVLESVRKITDMTLDVHLMIDRPYRYVRTFASAGADLIVLHVESDVPKNIEYAICEIQTAGRRAGLSLKPGTSHEAVLPYLDMLDLVLVMAVEPGFGGQSFMPDQLPKIRALRALIDGRGLDCELQVDGGINPETAKACVQAGANVLVAGSDIFNAPDRAARIAQLRSCR